MPDSPFTAEAASLWKTMTSHAGKAGFRIPEYQRPYNWNPDNIARFLEDTANGLHHLTESGVDESFTFLGTIILIAKKATREPDFDGFSLEIVDGQQRLTTIILALCSLAEAINKQFINLDRLPQEQKKWLHKEAEFQLGELHRCISGRFEGRGTSYPFPRLVRDVDIRAPEMPQYHYHSAIAGFINAFSQYYESGANTPFEFPALEGTPENERFRKNFDYIAGQIDCISSGSSGGITSTALDCEIVSPKHIERKGIRNLFDKLDDIYEDEAKRNRVLSAVSKEDGAQTIIRLILFASYMMKYIVLTKVETNDENSAFDIFDALNTTGEPLTAVETLKPQVMQHERILAGSPSELAFEHINEHIESRSNTPDQRQKETKELIVSYALYVDGTKQSKDLSAQRRYLRSRFDKIKKRERSEKIRDRKFTRQFVTNLEDMAAFRRHCWDHKGIAELTTFLSSPVLEPVQLCLRLLRDMNTSLAIPPLARYWRQSREHGGGGGGQEFLNALLALTGFIVLRRAATGGTANIDDQLRSLMEKSEAFPHGKALCVGTWDANTPPTLEEFRLKLQDCIRAIGVEDKKSWLDKATRIPLAQKNVPLTRFLLLAAADQSQPDDDKPGMWSREDFVQTDERSYLTYARWTSDAYLTIEHVAPVTRNSEELDNWHEGIYRDADFKHTLGNLVLLPKVENSSAGNAGWQRKKTFYSAFMARSRTQRLSYLQAAREAGYSITPAIERLVQTGERLHLLDPLEKVESWDRELIQARTENICSLAWSKISPWLFP